MEIKKYLTLFSLIPLIFLLTGCEDLSDRKYYKRYIPTTTYKLKALVVKEEMRLSGGFVLMVGSVSGSEDPYYIFYVQRPGGGIKLEKEIYSNVVVYEESIASTSAKAEQYTSTQHRDLNQEWVLTVPKGSIKEVLDLDLSNLE